MTRINLVRPEELCRQHLVAEYTELPRVFGLVRKAQDRGLTPATLGAPSAFVLGSGHLKFFYDKCLFLLRRQQSIVREMRARGYNPSFTYPNDLLEGIDLHWINDWEPTDADLELSRTRIAQRLATMALYSKPEKHRRVIEAPQTGEPEP